jgi:hypothetical protein
MRLKTENPNSIIKEALLFRVLSRAKRLTTLYVTTRLKTGNHNPKIKEASCVCLSVDAKY